MVLAQNHSKKQKFIFLIFLLLRSKSFSAKNILSSLTFENFIFESVHVVESVACVESHCGNSFRFPPEMDAQVQLAAD